MSQEKTLAAKRAVKVLIVDDHPAVREGLALRISRQPDMTVCGEAADIAEALRLAVLTDPDVAVIDISLKSESGIDLVRRLTAANDHLRILIWSMHDASVYAERALRAGAHGYINKEQATDQIIHAIHHVLAGKVYLAEPVADQLLNRVVGKRGEFVDRSPHKCLSDRELEAFRFIGQGLSTREVAEKMQVSTKTIETFRARIKDKLNLGSPNELVHRAVEWVLQNT